MLALRQNSPGAHPHHPTHAGQAETANVDPSPPEAAVVIVVFAELAIENGMVRPHLIPPPAGGRDHQ